MMRIGLIPKLLLSGLLLLLVMIAGIGIAVHSTFETNLSDYLNRVETEQIRPLADLLGSEYEKQGSWDFLYRDRAVWPNLIGRALRGKAPPPGGPEYWSQELRGMLPRLTVVDNAGFELIRSPLPPRGRVAEHRKGMTEIPILAKGKQVGSLQMVHTPIPVKRLDEQFRTDQLHSFLLAAIPALFVTVLLAVALGYHFTRPLQRLKRQLHRLAGGDYKTRLPVSRYDELGQLTADLNHLANVLQRSEAQRREGMASVSHELRTPIATMIASVEAMQDGIRPLNAEQLERLSGTMEHLNTLVDDLYELALADVGKLVCQRDPLEWDRVIDESVLAMRNKLEGRGLKLECDLEQGITLNGDARRLRQVVINLLENCCRYTEQNGTVWIRLQQDKGKAVMTVSDSGPGVGSEYFDSLFVRFSRNDASRSREHGGAGLGLALVKAIAEAHQGSVEAFISERGGLGIRVSLPLG